MNATEAENHIKKTYQLRRSYGNKLLILISILSIIWSFGIGIGSYGLSNSEENFYNYGVALIFIGLFFLMFIFIPYREYVDIKIEKILNDYSFNDNIEYFLLSEKEKDFFESYKK